MAGWIPFQYGQHTKGKQQTWLRPILQPIIGKQFRGYKQFKHVVVPIRVVDTRIYREPKPDEAFIFDFVAAFKHAFNKQVTIAQGLLLEPPRTGIR